MSELYNRDFAMTIGGFPLETQLSDAFQSDRTQPMLKAEFTIERNSNKDPNTAEITVYNLGLDNRTKLQEGSNLAERIRKVKQIYDWPLVIEAGYVGSREVLFSGNITFATSRREGVDWITDIECGDGEKRYRDSRINESFGPGTSVLSVINRVATALDLSKGNLAEKLGSGRYRKGYSVFEQGFVATGRASDVLDKLLTSAGYTWSIQDGQLQILAPNETTFEEVVILRKDTGLIGSPEKGEKGKITVKSLLQGKLKPGRRLIVESEMISGTYKIERIQHQGDTWGRDWYTELEAKPV